MANTGIVQRFGTKAELTVDTPRQGELVFATDTGEFGYLNAISALIWINFQDYFEKQEFVDNAGDASDAGKPVVLNAEGYIDDSMVKTHAFSLQGDFTPVQGAGQEYPDVTGLDVGSFWIIVGVDDALGFTFSYGDLINETVFNGDQLLFGKEGFIINRGAVNPEAYYRLDGTKPLLADFDGGGFKVTNIADGVAVDDGVTIGQWNIKFDGLATSGNMVIENGVNLITDTTTTIIPNGHLLGYSVANSGDPLLTDGTAIVKFGHLGSALEFEGIINNDLILRNEVAVASFDENTSPKNLILRGNDDVNAGTPLAYTNDVVVGDVDILTTLRATFGFDPVVRKGVYGNTTDYKIYTNEDFVVGDFAPVVHDHLLSGLDNDNGSGGAYFATTVLLTSGLNTKVDNPTTPSGAGYLVLARDAGNTSNTWASIDKAYVGLGLVDNTADIDKPVSTATQTALDLKADDTDLTTHTGDVANPHGVTKVQVGLDLVDNTSDALKPISDATQTALDLKADDTVLNAHTGDLANPHGVTKTQIGLGSVDDTTDLAKPISTATQTALDDKFDGLTASGDMVIESGVAITTDASVTQTPLANIVDYSVTSGDPILTDGTALINIGQADVGINLNGLLFNPLLMKNNTALQAYDSAYTSIKNLVSRGAEEANTGTPVAYTNDVVVGDSGILSVIRATSGLDPVVRKGVFGATDDYKIYTAEDFVTTDFEPANTNIQTHITTVTGNPHGVTATEVGLGSVDDTADLDKPISTATQTALNLKADDTDLTTHTGDVANPHSVTQAQVGLGNVENFAMADMTVSTATQTALDLKVDDTEITNIDNTSDADKPVSTATQTALDLKVDNGVAVLWKGIWTDGNYVPNDMVKDGTSTAICVTATTERPSPQDVGFPENDTKDKALVDITGPTEVVKMVHNFTATKAGFIRELLVKVPTFDGDTIVRVLTVFNTVTTIHDNLILQSGTWNLLGAGNFNIDIGDTFKVELSIYNRGTSQGISGGWTTTANVAPALGEVYMNSTNNPTTISYNYEDLDGTDRTTELNAVAVGSIIDIGETTDTSRYIEARVDIIDTAPTGYVTYTVTTLDNNKDVRVGAVTTTNIDTPISQPTHYYELTADRPANNPSYATITSELYFNGVDQSVTNSAFGIDLQFQEAYISPDWVII